MLLNNYSVDNTMITEITYFVLFSLYGLSFPRFECFFICSQPLLLIETQVPEIAGDVQKALMQSLFYNAKDRVRGL